MQCDEGGHVAPLAAFPRVMVPTQASGAVRTDAAGAPAASGSSNPYPSRALATSFDVLREIICVDTRLDSALRSRLSDQTPALQAFGVKSPAETRRMNS